MTAALLMLAGFAYSPMPSSIIRGAEPWMASNIAYLSADVGASCSADSALELSCLVSDDVAVEVRQDHDVEIAVDLIVHEVRSHDVHIPVVSL